ncbi:hypothetical protein D3C73_1436670 [compost metagenome]
MVVVFYCEQPLQEIRFDHDTTQMFYYIFRAIVELQHLALTHLHQPQYWHVDIQYPVFV